MDLLLDENLSFRLCRLLANHLDRVTHVRNVGLTGADDVAIWNYAKERGCLIVSQDSDFLHRAELYGSPPKVIWLRLGNATKEPFASLLIEARASLERFAGDPEKSIYILPTTHLT